MKIDSALTHALAGIQRGLHGARENAASIAGADQMNGRDPAGLVDPLVGLIENRLQVQASAKAMKAADEMIGSLFDDKA